MEDESGIVYFSLESHYSVSIVTEFQHGIPANLTGIPHHIKIILFLKQTLKLFIA